jgi:hypothetical protein
MSSSSSDDDPEWSPQDLIDFEMDKDYLTMEIHSLKALMGKASVDLKTKKLQLATMFDEASCIQEVLEKEFSKKHLQRQIIFLEKKCIEYSDRTSELELKLLKAKTILKDKENVLKPLIRPTTPVPKNVTPSSKGKGGVCPFCNEQKSDVTRHANRMHTPQKDVQFICTTCDPVGLPPKRPTFETKHDFNMLIKHSTPIHTSVNIVRKHLKLLLRWKTTTGRGGLGRHW